MSVSSLTSRLRAWDPKNAPFEWTVINAVCCAWSFVLLVIVVFATDDSTSKKLAKAQYLVYDLLTTFVWVFETSLVAVFDYDVTSLEQWAEFAVSIYFLGDSATVLYKWKLEKEHTSLMGIAISVNFVAYLYVTSACIRDLNRRQDFDGVGNVDNSDGLLPLDENPTEDTPLAEKTTAVS